MCQTNYYLLCHMQVDIILGGQLLIAYSGYYSFTHDVNYPSEMLQLIYCF